MTVGELIAELSRYPADMTVVVAVNDFGIGYDKPELSGVTLRPDGDFAYAVGPGTPDSVMALCLGG
jgi:hypothetical protein